MPFPFDKYPWLNFQELNLAYFIKHFREIFAQWDQLYHDMLAWQAQTDEEFESWKAAVNASLDAWKTAVEDTLSAWRSGVEAGLEDWKDITEQDIQAWEADTLAAFTSWQTQAETAFEIIRVQAAASATAAENSAIASQAARTGAETAASSIQSEVAQIEENRDGVTQLQDEVLHASVFPQETSFLDPVDRPIRIRFSDILGAARHTLRTIGPDGVTVIASNGMDMLIFPVPFPSFVFTVIGTFTAYVISQYSDCNIGDTLAVVEQLTPVVDPDNTSSKTYTVNYSSAFYILLIFPYSYAGAMLASTGAMFTAKGLQTDIYQDSFRRYAEGEADSPDLPFAVSDFPGKLVSTSGSTIGAISNNASYNTIAFEAPIDCYVSSANAIRAVRDYTSPDGVNNPAYNHSVVYSSAQERIPRFAVPAGLWVVLSFSVNDTPDLRTSIMQDYTLSHLISAPDLMLTPAQKGSPMYLYTASGQNQYLHIYYPSAQEGKKYVHYRLQNTPVTGRLVNTWQIGKISGCSFNGTSMNEELDIIDSGEFESAMKEAFWDPTGGPDGQGAFYPASDYNGGANHSCEQTVDFALSIDGKLIADISSLPANLTAFSQITAVEISNLIRVDDHDIIYAEHEKRWTFDGTSTAFDQTITFKVGTYINGWECIMCKAIKDALDHGSRRDRVGIENVGQVSPWVNIHTFGNTMAYKFYGPHATVSVTGYCKEHAIDGPPNDHTTTGTTHKNVGDLWIDEQNKVVDQVPVPFYSKLYFDYWGDATIAKPVQVAEGDTVYSGAEYIVEYS